MLTTLERLAKRARYDFQIGDETFCVRSLTIGECEDLDKLPEELRTPYAIGCGLIDDAGNQVMPRVPVPTYPKGSPEEAAAVAAGKPNDLRPQSNEEYATAIYDSLRPVPPDAVVKLIENIWKVTKAAPVEELVKN